MHSKFGFTACSHYSVSRYSIIRLRHRLKHRRRSRTATLPTTRSLINDLHLRATSLHRWLFVYRVKEDSKITKQLCFSSSSTLRLEPHPPSLRFTLERESSCYLTVRSDWLSLLRTSLVEKKSLFLVTPNLDEPKRTSKLAGVTEERQELTSLTPPPGLKDGPVLSPHTFSGDTGHTFRRRRRNSCFHHWPPCPLGHPFPPSRLPTRMTAPYVAAGGLRLHSTPRPWTSF